MGDKVSKKLKVVLLSHTPEPEKLVASSAKLCYSQAGITDLMEKQEDDAVKQFIDMLMNMGHESPVEHVAFTFGIEGVSRALTHQLVRHRIGASYSQQSQRYVKLEQFEYIMPPSIERNPKVAEMYLNSMARAQEDYNKIADELYNGYYAEFISEGYSERKAKTTAEKKAIEDARYVFPNACETKIVVTMNARCLMNFFHHRCCERAQWEIRELATQMLILVREVAPTLFKYAGPSCLNAACPEGSMTCGKIKEVREKYKNL